MADSVASQDFADYIGRPEGRTDRFDEHRIGNLAALLDTDVEELAPGGELPPLAHWLYFNSWAPQSLLGSDGHPKRGGFMPPVALPRRMFAGARIVFHHPLRVDDVAQRVATIASINRKEGSAGELVFVTVKHEISDFMGVAIEEEQDIVYRGNAPSGAQQAASNEEPAPVGADAIVTRIDVTPVMLFRFSALTDNGHRIHYDFPYVTKTEGYPGLVVHGPLQAMLLVDLVRRNFPGTLARFSFQARRPLFDTSPFECAGWRDGGKIQLMTRDLDGRLAMSATAELA
ncbi:MAG: FAS1-like dehydratase domain-containing protein [Vulcanimicrobiaceae bacterium]